MAGSANVTHSELQQYMLKLIQEHGRVDMRKAMVRIWRRVVKLDGEVANAANRNRNGDGP
jgi:hypothetical protein